MTMNINIAAVRIGREVPVAEASLDEALISVSSLMKTMVQARRDTGVGPSTGQATIARLARAQMSLVTASSDMLRVHSDLAKLAKVHAGMDLHEHCTDGHLESESVAKLTAVG
jgi:hypothetical protein